MALPAFSGILHVWSCSCEEDQEVAGECQHSFAPGGPAIHSVGQVGHSAHCTLQNMKCSDNYLQFRERRDRECYHYSSMPIPGVRSLVISFGCKDQGSIGTVGSYTYKRSSLGNLS